MTSKLLWLGCTGFVLGSAMGHMKSTKQPAQCLAAGECNPDLKNFTREEVQRHRGGANKGDGGDGRIFVTYRCGVYDVTSFLAQHPGGAKRLMLAAGGDIEPFWRQFTLHDDDNVRKILESHRIGNVVGYRAETAEEKAAHAKALEAVWAKEPSRSLGMAVLSKRPFNAETPEIALEEFLTPNDLFFVRNHMPVPAKALEKDASKQWCVSVSGEGLVSQCIPLEVLKASFPQHSVTTTIQCGGNRRSEMAAAHPEAPAVKGLAWTNGGIGTATWTGVRLRDVLRAAKRGPTPPNAELLHVQFEGADKDAAGHYHVSVPYPLVMDKNSEALIAFEMNGQPIPADHGFPARAIVPGTVGVRNCKWLTTVKVQQEEAGSVWQQHDYKNFPNWTNKPDASLPSVYAMPVQSAITDASYDANRDCLDVKGYAYAGGGVPVQRVELSFDGGRTFERAADMVPVPAGVAAASGSSLVTTKQNAWAWRLLNTAVDVDSIRAAPQVNADGNRYYRTCIRAIDGHHNTQPQVAAHSFRGLLYNGYSCRDVLLGD